MATQDDNDLPPDTGNQEPGQPEARRTRKGRRGGGESKHSERRMESVERQAEALEYRKLGLSYSQIAEKMELGSPQTAWNMVESALKRVLEEPAEEVRKMELARLDAMWLSVYGNACRGDLQAISTCVRLMERRAKLVGIDMPEKRELTGANGTPLAVAPTIVIGGPGEEGEPAVAGVSVVPVEAIAE